MQRKKPIIKSNVSGLITRRRKAQGFTNSAIFCKEVGIEKSTYSGIEAGYDFKFSTFLRVCRKLKISPSELLKDLDF